MRRSREPVIGLAIGWVRVGPQAALLGGLLGAGWYSVFPPEYRARAERLAARRVLIVKLSALGDIVFVDGVEGSRY